MRYHLLCCIVLMLILKLANAQDQPASPKPNWYNLDLSQDGMFGISMDKAYKDLLNQKSPAPVIIAVIDGGLDINHEDLKNIIWTNRGEIPGNGQDDDGNGYVDDVHGWNFLGSSSESFEFDNDLIVKQVRKFKKRFAGIDSTTVANKDLTDYKNYIALKKELSASQKRSRESMENTKNFLSDLNLVLKQIGKDHPKLDDFNSFMPTNDAEAKAQKFIIQVLQVNPDFEAYMNQTKAQFENYQNDLDFHLNMDYEPRAKFSDEYLKAKFRYYGNGNVYGAVPPAHGTHVAGTIGAERNNGIGINGISNTVRVMPIRAIPDGYSDDRDQANAIRYAVANGAKIINMSFGLSVALDSKLVKEAVEYAVDNDVLFIQAAGNGGENLDVNKGYPDRHDPKDKKLVDVFIKVAASGFTDDNQLSLPFSNYGQESVDVFAPGLAITSTVPNNKYEAHSGTSMAAPVVSGLVAVIRSYYPKLSAKQVKEIITKSVMKRDALKKLSITGGVVNAYQALKIASTY